jgi:hypothetical protein
VLARLRETLLLRPGLRSRLDDGSDVFPLTAHLGGYEDHDQTAIPVHVHVGTLTLAPDGTAVLKLEYQAALARPAPPQEG